MAAFQGERHHNAKLTPDKVRDIRARRANGETALVIWNAYPEIESLGTINAVLSGRTWKHVTS